jgi:conserved repeat domain
LVKPEKTKNKTWVMISVMAVVIIISLVSYFYFFYFKNPGLAGMKSWTTSVEKPETSESITQDGSSGQSEAKPDLSIVKVSVERVDTKSADAGNDGSKNTDGIENTNSTYTSANTSTSSDTSANTSASSDTSANTSTSSDTSANTSASSDTSASTDTSASAKKSDEIYIGDTVKYDILVKNNGSQTAKNIKVIDLPPDKLENINMAEGSGGSYDPFSRKIVLDIAEIGAGETIKIDFTGFISNDLNDADIIDNKVSALYAGTVIAEKSTGLSVSGLPDYTTTLVKVEDVNGSKIRAKDILKYSVIVKNSGKKTGGDIVLNCPMPTSTGYVGGTASGSGLVISPNKSLLQFNIGNIEPGAQKEFSFEVFVAEYLTFSTEIKSGFFIADGQEKISLENPSVTTEASVFQTVVCMGDSQVVLSDYTTQLGLLLNNQYSYAVFNVIPTGVEGEMANFAIQRFDKDVRMHNPDIIVIGYGCNDAGEATGLYRYHMDILLRQAVSTGAKVIVYGVGYIDMSIPKWLGKANYITLNEILKTDICPQYGAIYVDLYGPMSKDYKKYIKADGMHWTEAGATLVAGEVFKAITTVLDSEGKIQTDTKK